MRGRELEVKGAGNEEKGRKVERVGLKVQIQVQLHESASESE